MANGSPLSFKEGVSGNLQPNSTLLLKEMQGLLAKLETEDKLYFSLNEAGSKVRVMLHRSRIQVTAPLINYQTTWIPLLDLTERFVKRLGLGDTFNAIHLSVSWWPVLWPVEKWPVF